MRFKFLEVTALAVAAIPTLPLLPLLPVLLAGCGDSTHTPGTLPGTLAPGGLVILSSDYTVVTLSLYDPTSATLVRDDCIDSATTGGAIVQKLSGDVTLPTQGDPVGHELVAIDRSSATLTFVDPATCAVRRQIPVGGVGADGAGIAGFKANPHDLIRIDAHKAYVTRYETNATPTPALADLDEGNDLLVLDPSSGQIQKRIDLTGEATADAGVLARPDRGVYAEGRLYVTLGNLSLDFAVAGAGRVVAIDPVTDTVLGHIDLPDQKGCSGIEYLPTTHKLYVACRTFTDDWATQIATSALVEIDVSGSGLGTLGRVTAASALGAQPLTSGYAAVMDGVAYVQQSGSFAKPELGMPASTDALSAVSLATGATQKMFDGGAYNLGRAATVSANRRVYLPDGDPTMPRVRVFDGSSAATVSAADFEANPSGHLPPREVAQY